MYSVGYRMSDWWTGKDVEWSGRDLILELSRHSPLETEENKKNLKRASLRTEIWTRGIPNKRQEP
jgi:hypothetical protein